MAPSILTSPFTFSNLAWVLRDLGKAAEARPLLERALSIHETLYGPTHPESLRDRERLDAVLRDLAKPSPPGSEG